VLHLADALKQFRSPFFVGCWALERYHQPCKEAASNGRGIDVSVFNHHAERVNRSVDAAAALEKAATMAETPVSKLLTDFATSQFHGAVHPSLFLANRAMQYQIECDLLPGPLVAEWPMTAVTPSSIGVVPETLFRLVDTLNECSPAGVRFSIAATEPLYKLKAVKVRGVCQMGIIWCAFLCLHCPPLGEWGHICGGGVRRVALSRRRRQRGSLGRQDYRSVCFQEFDVQWLTNCYVGAYQS
jgi:hypothetical protein